MMTNHDNGHELLCRVMPNLANQLRTPLNNLYSALQRILDDEGGEEKKADKAPDLAVLYQSYFRMLRLMGNLSDAPTLLDEDSLLLVNDDIVAFVQGVCDRAEEPVELCGQRLHYESDKKFHVIAFNAAGLERLLLNLLSNAIKFTGPGGVITVSVRVRTAAVEIAVEDTGDGLDPEEQDTLFDRYRYPDLLDPAPQGLGLGLPLCRRVAQGHGGTILLTSTPHAGTKAVVSLPNRRIEHTKLRDMAFDYSGGFSHTLMELSDALPSYAFLPNRLD